MEIGVESVRRALGHATQFANLADQRFAGSDARADLGQGQEVGQDRNHVGLEPLAAAHQPVQVDPLRRRHLLVSLQLEEHLRPLGVGFVQPADLAFRDPVGGLARKFHLDAAVRVGEASFEDAFLHRADDVVGAVDGQAVGVVLSRPFS